MFGKRSDRISEGEAWLTMAEDLEAVGSYSSRLIVEMIAADSGVLLTWKGNPSVNWSDLLRGYLKIE